MRVIGTAGHVDHGKTSLVRRLTGIDTDRLAEEKARQMTIDLGYAWLTTPGGTQVGIIDVPGHQDFIENMLAGVGGIDAVILVIAADEGVMPQTREHLAILHLLGIQAGCVALTKTDMIDDPEWLSIIEQDIRDVLRGTVLADAQIIRVSATRGDGIESLVEHLDRLLDGLPPRSNAKSPRMPIDRAFVMPGFGTVVTGTLGSGRLQLGQEVVVQPSGLHARIRTLQTYQTNVTVAEAGTRCAVNLAGVDRASVRRGEVLALPGTLQPTTMIDVQYDHLSSAARPLMHNAIIKLFTGTAEAIGIVRVLGGDLVAPGESGWLQVMLREPIACVAGDRFIVRIPSPAETVGGGLIADPHPTARHRRHDPDVLSRLQTRLLGSDEEQLAQRLDHPEPARIIDIRKSVEDFEPVLQRAVEQSLVVQLTNDLIWSAERLDAALTLLTATLADFHRDNPLKAGMPREALRGRMSMRQTAFNAVMSAAATEIRDGAVVCLKAFTLTLSDEQQTAASALLKAFETSPFSPPSVAEAQQQVGTDLFHALIELGRLVAVQADVVMTPDAYREMARGAVALMEADGVVSVRSLRDRFQSSRKFAIALLENLDGLGITRRTGDDRARGSAELPTELS